MVGDVVGDGDGDDPHPRLRPEPMPPDRIALIRRIWRSPIHLRPCQHNVRDDGWLLSGLEQGGVIRMHGPYVFSGHWWREDLQRDYVFAETKRGECLWMFYDRRARRWFEQGMIE